MIFLSRVRRKQPFKELGFQYGCGAETAREYFCEMLMTTKRYETTDFLLDLSFFANRNPNCGSDRNDSSCGACVGG